MYAHVQYPVATGALDSRVAVVTCPECTYLKGGDCVVCIDGEDHPACSGCSDGRTVWYRRPLFVSVSTAVCVAITASVVVHQLEKHWTWLRRLKS